MVDGLRNEGCRRFQEFDRFSIIRNGKGGIVGYIRLDELCL